MTQTNKPDYNEQEKHFLQQITIEDVITEIRRELKTRERVYPNWIEQGKITQSCADYRRMCLEANLIFLEEIAKQTAAQQSLF